MEENSPATSAPQMRFGKIDDLSSRVAVAVDAARKYLFSQQHEDGYWCGELEADATLEADYIILHTLLGTEKTDRIPKAANYILQHQNEDGGWSTYSGGATNLSASVKSYFGLKLAGYKSDHPALARARQTILELGGVTEVNTFTKLYLCFFGQYDYDAVPAIPPEIVLFPNWFWFNIYEISSWSRAMLVPLSICYAKKPFKKISDEMGVEELFVGGRDKSRMHLHWDKKWLSWRNFFLVLDRTAHWFERVHVRPLRSVALRQAERWMLRRFEMSDGLAGIFPSIMNSVIALRVLGYSIDDPQVIRAMDEFEKLGIEEEDTFRMQPCVSPVWDTAIAVHALGEAGCAPQPSLTASADWLLSKEVRRKGDWSIKRPNVEPSGWYFEFANEWYPDIDDTAQVLLALAQSSATDSEAQRATRKRAVDWLLAMQGSDGGWAAFDVDNNWNFLSSVPFADHNAMLDPTCPDITGRVLEALAACGVPNSHTAVRRGVAYLKRSQEADGSWYGRWGVDYIYGTYLALRGLRASGENDHEAFILRAGEWLRSIQNAE